MHNLDVKIAPKFSDKEGSDIIVNEIYCEKKGCQGMPEMDAEQLCLESKVAVLSMDEFVPRYELSNRAKQEPKDGQTV